MLPILIVATVAVGLAWGSYRYLESVPRMGAPAWLRAVALAGLGLLLLDPAFERGAGNRPPLVLLDTSPSTGAVGGSGATLRDSASRLGVVQAFGTDGTTRLEPALRAAAASDREIVILTDGEVQDRAALEGPLLHRAQVVTIPRQPVADLALVRLTAPARVVVRDTLELLAEWRAVEGEGALPDSVALVVRSGTRALARATHPAGAGRAHIRLPAARLGAGQHVLDVSIDGDPDRQPATDTRHALVLVTPTPGVLVLAQPGDWDARFLLRALTQVTDLPVAGYLQLGAAGWRHMGSLETVTEAEVRAAADRADLLVLKGVPLGGDPGGRARAVVRWPSGAGGETVVGGDWYLTGEGAAPIAGMPVDRDSLPPLTRLTPTEPGPSSWTLGTAQLGRRGTPRPVMTGEIRGGRRELRVWADGFWRWSFRGGSSEQAYRTLVAAVTSWLLAAPDSTGGRLRVVQAVVERDRPVRFSWVGDSTPTSLAVTLASRTAERADTLSFDGDGTAELSLPPATWRYASAAGNGTVVVEAYSSELVPGPVTLSSAPARLGPPEQRVPLRERWWMYLLVVAAFGGEWWARRRAGLR